MAIELFGPEIGVYALLACVVSYLFSGHTGIYRAQRGGQFKLQPAPDVTGHEGQPRVQSSKTENVSKAVDE
jgi:H+/Cl- antiporter ClcA